MTRRRRLATTQLSLFAFQDIITCVMGVMLLLTLILCLQLTTTSVASHDQRAAATVADLRQREKQLQEELRQLRATAQARQALLNSGAVNDTRILRDSVREANFENSRAQEVAAKERAEQATANARLEDMRAEQLRRQQEEEEIRQLRQQNQRLGDAVARYEAGQRIIYNSHSSSSQRCWLVECNSERDFRAAPIGESQVPLTFTSATDAEAWMLKVCGRGDALMLLVKPDSADVFDPITTTLRTQGAAFGFDLLPQDRFAIDPVTGAVPQ